MENNELYFRLALSLINGIGPVRYKKLISVYESAENVFRQSLKSLKHNSFLSDQHIDAIRDFRDFETVNRELDYHEKNNISVHCFDDPGYPTKLKNCLDGPVILFKKGHTDLTHHRILSVIGTRSFTDYGRKVCEELIMQLKPYNVIIASGLAYGIDIIAHKACIKNEIPTLGVVAHGLDMMYPAAHRNTAKEMQQQGGVLSEYFSGAKLEKGNFPTRNRIVAGISDATIVIETDIRGGSMITADIAYSYNRDVFCFPGRSVDSKSAGCNYLIKKLKAQLVTGAADIAAELGWHDTAKPKPVQRTLFIEMTEDEQKIVRILGEKESTHIDELLALSQLNSSQVAGAMLNLEMQQILKVMPGKLISLC